MQCVAVLHDSEAKAENILEINYLRALWLFRGRVLFIEFCDCFGFWIKIIVLNLEVSFISEVGTFCPANYVLLSVKGDENNRAVVLNK